MLAVREIDGVTGDRVTEQPPRALTVSTDCGMAFRPSALNLRLDSRYRISLWDHPFTLKRKFLRRPPFPPQPPTKLLAGCAHLSHVQLLREALVQ